MGIETALMVGGSALSGALSNRKKTTTSTNTPSWTPQQQSMQALLANMMQADSGAGAGLGTMKVNALDRVNNTYKGASKRLDAGLASRGFEKSGAVGTGLADIEMARAGAIGGVESDFAGKEIDQKNRLMQLMQQFAFTSPGSTSTGTQPGNMMGGAIGGGLETAMSMFSLDKLMGGGGGGMQYELPGGGTSGVYR